mgnify:CR=1 FL=1
MGILNVLEEQETFGFTGRINILDKATGQFLGVLLQEEGTLINAVYRDVRGKKALFRVVLEDLKTEPSVRFVVEPEVVEEADRRFELSLHEFKKEARSLFEEAEKTRHLRPPDDLSLVIRSEFIVKGPDVTAEEFEILNALTEYHRVRDLYKNSNLFDFEITNALVSLRKKGALKVVSK